MTFKQRRQAHEQLVQEILSNHFDGIILSDTPLSLQEHIDYLRAEAEALRDSGEFTKSVMDQVKASAAFIVENFFHANGLDHLTVNYR